MKIIYYHFTDVSLIYKIDEPKQIFPSIKYGKIDNLKEFYCTMKKNIKLEKINKNILGDIAIITVNDLYTISDINQLKNIFKELEFNKIKIKKESEVLHEKKLLITDELSTRIINNQKQIIVYNYIDINNIIKILKLKDIDILNYRKEEIKTKKTCYYFVNNLGYFLK